MPPMAAWASEICPAKPVRTTTESIRPTQMADTVTALFQFTGNTVRASTARPAGRSRNHGEMRAGPSFGRRSSTWLRSGSPRPRTTSTSRMTRNGMASAAPVWCT